MVPSTYERKRGQAVLIILTGPSHSGKSTVAKALTRRIASLAVVKYDQFFFETLGALHNKEPGIDDFAIAYDLMLSTVRRLIARRRPTVLESTFTRVTRLNETSIHEIEFADALAIEPGAQAFQLFTSWNEIERRSKETNRLSEWVVRGTWEAHAKPWANCVRLDGSDDASSLANDILVKMKYADDIKDDQCR